MYFISLHPRVAHPFDLLHDREYHATLESVNVIVPFVHCNKQTKLLYQRTITLMIHYCALMPWRVFRSYLLDGTTRIEHRLLKMLCCHVWQCHQPSCCPRSEARREVAFPTIRGIFVHGQGPSAWRDCWVKGICTSSTPSAGSI